MKTIKDWLLMIAVVSMFCGFVFAARWVMNTIIKPNPAVGSIRISVQVNGYNDTIYVLQEFGGYGDAWINYDLKFMSDTLPDHFTFRQDAIYWRDKIAEDRKRIRFREVGVLK